MDENEVSVLTHYQVEKKIEAFLISTRMDRLKKAMDPDGTDISCLEILQAWQAECQAIFLEVSRISETRHQTLAASLRELIRQSQLDLVKLGEEV